MSDHRTAVVRLKTPDPFGIDGQLIEILGTAPASSPSAAMLGLREALRSSLDRAFLDYLARIMLLTGGIEEFLSGTIVFGKVGNDYHLVHETELEDDAAARLPTPPVGQEVFKVLKRLLATCGRRVRISEFSGIVVEWWPPGANGPIARGVYSSPGRGTRTQVSFFISFDDDDDARELRRQGDLLEDSEHNDDAHLDGT